MKDPDFKDELDCNDAAPYRRRQDFMEAVKAGDLATVKSTCAQFPDAIEWTTDSMYTAVQIAIYHCKQDVLEYLLEKGADINRRGHQGTPLIHAVHSHDDKSARWLLEKGADASLKNPEGETALMWAVLNEMKRVIPDLLQACPAALNMKDNDGNTPLARAAEWGYADTARLLVRQGADIAARNNSGETAADVALRRGHKNIPCIISDTVAEIAQGAHTGLETAITVSRRPLQLKRAASLCP